MVGDKLQFEKVKRKIVDTIDSNSTDYKILFNVITVDGFDIVLKNPERYHDLVFKGWFAKYMSGYISGDVSFKVLSKSVFEKKESDNVYFVFGIYRRYLSGDWSEKSGRGFYVSRSNFLQDVYFGVARAVPSEIFQIDCVEGEEEIARMVLVASRLSKSLARSVVPVLDFNNGEIVDYVAVGYEDVVFIELLRYLLQRSVIRDVS